MTTAKSNESENNFQNMILTSVIEKPVDSMKNLNDKN